jgi:hypothetical protein
VWLQAISVGFIERSAVDIEHGSFPGEFLPASHDYVGVLRIQLYQPRFAVAAIAAN